MNLRKIFRREIFVEFRQDFCFRRSSLKLQRHEKELDKNMLMSMVTKERNVEKSFRARLDELSADENKPAEAIDLPEEESSQRTNTRKKEGNMDCNLQPNFGTKSHWFD